MTISIQMLCYLGYVNLHQALMRHTLQSGSHLLAAHATIWFSLVE